LPRCCFGGNTNRLLRCYFGGNTSRFPLCFFRRDPRGFALCFLRGDTRGVAPCFLGRGRTLGFLSLGKMRGVRARRNLRRIDQAAEPRGDRWPALTGLDWRLSCLGVSRGSDG
jgi:hypothetical protein